MTDKQDDVELAIRHIRRIGRLNDLEQVLAVLNARKVELSSRALPGPPGLSRRVPVRRLVKPTPVSTLDPAHRQDPAYVAYSNAEHALSMFMRANGIAKRSAVQGQVREDFEKALSAWLAVKPKYKTSTTAAVRNAPAVAAPPPAAPGQHGSP